MRFEQLNGSLIESSPSTHLTEPVQLEKGQHWDIIQFVIVPKMTEAVILGLSWLDKWIPIIWWEGEERKMRI